MLCNIYTYIYIYIYILTKTISQHYQGGYILEVTFTHTSVMKHKKI